MTAPCHRAEPHRAASAGFTLLELIAALAIAAIALATAAPGLATVLLDARRQADLNAFVTAVQLARSEAAKHGRPIVLCGSADLATCADDYSAGWLVLAADDRRVLLGYRASLQGSIASNRRVYEFRPYGRRSTNGTVTFCDRRGAAAARAVIVSYTGRPRIAASGPGRTLTCAGGS